MKSTSCRRHGSLGSLSPHILTVYSSCSGRDAIHWTRPRNVGVNFRAVQVGEMGVVFFVICFVLPVGRHSRLAVFVSATRSHLALIRHSENLLFNWSSAFDPATGRLK